MVNVNIEDVVKADLPTFKRVLGILRGYYSVPQVRPGVSTEQLMFNAGQYSVLENLQDIVDRVESEAGVIKET